MGPRRKVKPCDGELEASRQFLLQVFFWPEECS
jgi:hypothetical protein